MNNNEDMLYRFSLPPAGFEGNVLQAHGARVSAIILLTLPPRQILTVESIEKDSHSGLPAHGLSTEEYVTSCSLLISSPKCLAG